MGKLGSIVWTTSIWLCAMNALGEPTPRSLRSATTAALKGIEFLIKDTADWRKKTDCATCHHGAVTMWVLAEAKQAGLSVDENSLVDIRNWTKARFVPKPNEPLNLANGFEIPSLAIPLMAASLWTDPTGANADELDRMARHLLDRQQADGVWPIQQRNPHPVFDHRDSLAVWFTLALQPVAEGSSPMKDLAAQAMGRSLKWIQENAPQDTTQSESLRLILAGRKPQSGQDSQRWVKSLLKRQNADGGWAQTRALQSDAYATGEALYALRLAGMKPDSRAISRGVEFLMNTQLPDGSWKMVPRVTPEREASKNLNPINHFASAWATIALARCITEPR